MPVPNPYAANPYGSPFSANPMESYGFPQQLSNIFSNFYKGPSQASQTTAQNLEYQVPIDRRIMSDYQRDVDSAVSRETIYGVNGDPRIFDVLDTLNDLNVVSDEGKKAVDTEREFSRAREQGRDSFRVGDDRFQVSGNSYTQVDSKGNAIQQKDADGNNITAQEFQDDTRRRAQKARITAGQFINETNLGRMIGDPTNFGDTRDIQDAANTIVEDIMRSSNAPRFGSPGSEEDIRSRGVMSREVTNALLEGMQTNGKLDTKQFGDSQTSSTILKGFAKSGINDLDKAIKEIVSSTGEITTTVDKNQLTGAVLPKVKAMVGALEGLKEIYKEADPGKLMRIAAEVTGLNPNDMRNATKIESQVAEMSFMADQFGVKPLEYMNNVVSTAQGLAQAGFGQQMAGQLAQQITMNSEAEALAQKAFADPEAGGFRAMSSASIRERDIQSMSAILNEDSPELRMFAGAQKLANDARGGRSGLTDETQAFLNRAIQSGDEGDFKRLAEMVKQETGQDLELLGRDPKALLQRLGREDEFFDFAQNQLRSRNMRSRDIETLSKEGFGSTPSDQMREMRDEDGNVVFKTRDTDEVLDELMNTPTGEEGEEISNNERIRAFEESLIETDKNRDINDQVFQYDSSGEVRRDSSGRALTDQSNQSETAQEVRRQLDANIEANTPYEVDENGRPVIGEDGKPVFKETAAGQQAKEAYEYSRFERDEEGNKISEREQMNRSDFEQISALFQLGGPEDVRKVAATALGLELDEDGKVVGEDASAIEQRKEMEAVQQQLDAGEITEQEARDKRQEIQDRFDTGRTLKLSEQIQSTEGFRDTMDRELDSEGLIEEGSEIQKQINEIDTQLSDETLGEEEREDLEKQKQDLVERQDKLIEDRISDVEEGTATDLEPEQREQVEESIRKAIGETTNAKENAEDAIEKIDQETEEKLKDPDLTPEKREEILAEAEEQKDVVNKNLEKVQANQKTDVDADVGAVVSVEQAKETLETTNKVDSLSGKKTTFSTVVNADAARDSAIGVSGVNLSRDERLEASQKAVEDRKRREKMDAALGPDAFGEGGILDGFMEGTENQSQEAVDKLIADKKFTRDEIAEAQKSIGGDDGTLDKMQEKIVESSVTVDGKASKGFVELAKKLQDSNSPAKEDADVVKESVAESLVGDNSLDLTKEEQKSINTTESAQETVNNAIKKAAEGLELTALEQEIVKRISEVSINQDRRAEEEGRSGLGAAEKVGTAEQATKLDGLEKALEALNKTIEENAKAEEDKAKEVTFAEGTTFQAILSQDLKTITMRAE